MITRPIFFILLGIWPLLSYSQACGTTTSDQLQWWPRYQAHLQALSAKDQLDTDYYIPLAVHLVARDNGAGRSPLSTALQVLCELNELYAPAGIEFYLAPAGFNFIDDDGVFSNSDFSLNQITMESHQRDSALNVFVVNTFGASNVVGAYDSAKDWIIIQRNAFLAGNRTLAHEIGHYFSLLHPHFGWDASAWDINIHGNPAPLISPDGSTPTELVDGSNCSEAGDRLCDTPPDYNLGLNWQQSCIYTGEAQDPNGQAVDPDESLLMSYFSDDCRSAFSDMQIAMMQLDLEDTARAHLFPAEAPTTMPLANSVVLEQPTGMSPAIDRVVTFSWEALPEASHYYLEFDRSPRFNLDPKGYLLTTNTLDLSFDWLENITYYWRVWAWNEVSICTPPSTTYTFNIELISKQTAVEPPTNQLSISSTSKGIILGGALSQAQQFQLRLYQLDGRLAHTALVHLVAGTSQQFVATPQLPTGLYIATLEGDLQHQQLIFVGF